MGRPKLKIDEDLVYDLANIHCTDIEIASIVGCSVDTLTNRFSEILDKGRNDGKKKLRRALWNLANKGNLGALIWLSKNHLGMKDKDDDAKKEEIKVVIEDYRVKP